MKTVRFAMYLLYSYYKRGRWERVPYFHMLVAISLVGFINIITLLALVSDTDWLFRVNKDAFFPSFFLIAGTIGTLLSIVGKKQVLESLVYSREKIKIGMRFLVLYCVFSFFILFFTIFMLTKGRSGDDEPIKITPGINAPSQ